jgi:hypothetical protein
MPGDADLYESLDAELSSLGEKTRSLVISTLEAKGVLFRPQSLDAEKIDEILRELFGTGSDAIMSSAHNRLQQKLVLGFDESQMAGSLQKIKKWLETNQEKTRE